VGEGLIGGLRDALEVVRAAVGAWRSGVFGFRRVVDELVDRPYSTVRGWIRAVARGSSGWALDEFADLILPAVVGRG